MRSLEFKTGMVEPVAICGMACRLPGSSNTPSALWELIMRKGDGVCPVPASRFNAEAFYSPIEGRAGSIKVDRAHFLDSDLKGFDCGFFEISPHEAESLDPQVKLLLECAWECLESAGTTLDVVATPGNRVGCYVGAFNSDYADLMGKDAEWTHSHSFTGTGKAMLSNRLSYTFNLHGPSMTIDTGCSASLVAFHTACRAIAVGEISSALVCGANLYLLPDLIMTAFANQIISPTATSHSFDAKADGYGRAEGINCVYLKGLSQAMRDGDPVRAIVRGTACNSDGRTLGIANPNAATQELVIREAYRIAGLGFADTGLVELHATGTPVGDPVEVGVVGKVIGQARRGKGVFINSIKANVGHAEASSGLSSVIKVVQALEHSIIPPQANFERLNPHIDLENWNLQIPTLPIAWPTGPIKRASINNWGYGGTNVHAIIDAPPIEISKKKFILEKKHPLNKACQSAELIKRPFLLPFTANDKTALDGLIGKVCEIPGVVGDEDLIDIAYTLSRRPSHFNRGFVVARANQSSLSDLISNGSLSEGEKSADVPSITFVFTGQGAQWPQMGQDLLQGFPSARRDLDFMQHVLDELSDGPTWRLKDELLAPAETSRIQEASRSQTLCTALQILIVNILRDWGIRPNAVIGHSSGEISAAYAAGIITASEAIIVAYYRGKCINDVISSGTDGMMAVGLTPEEVADYIDCNISIACYNSPKNTTLSGPKAELITLGARLKAQEIMNRILKVNYGYHSRHIYDAGDSYSAAIAGRIHVQKSSPGVQVFSTVSGGKATEDYGSEQYWRRNLEAPVRFTQGLGNLLKSSPAQYLIEIGPHSALASSVRQIRDSLGFSETKIRYVSAFERQRPAFETILGCCGSLWLTGYKVDLVAINSIQSDDGSTSRNGTFIVDFPTYAWNRTQRWFEGRLCREWRFRQNERHDLIGSKIPGGNGMEIQWRNVLRCKDVGWLTSHKFHKVPGLPVACHLAMALEGMSQILDASKVVRKGYRVRNFGVKAGIFVPEDQDGIEIMLSMRQLPIQIFANSTDWWEFHTWSYSKQWTEHSSGLIGAENDNESFKLDDFKEKWQRSLNLERWYQQMSLHGLEFSDEFRGFSNVKHHGPSRTTTADSDERIAYKALPQQSRYVYHPTTIDKCLQLIMLTFYFAPPYLSHMLVPVFIEDVYFAAPDTKTKQFSIVSKTEVPGRNRGNGAVQAFDCETGQLLMDFVGVGWKSIDEDPTAYALRSKELGPLKAPYLRSVWKPDLDRLRHNTRDVFVHNEMDCSQLVSDMERLVCLWSSLMLKTVERAEIPAKPFLVNYIDWMKLIMADPKAENLPMKTVDRKIEINRLYSLYEKSCLDIILMKRVFDNFDSLITSEMEPIEILIGHDDLLSRFYTTGLGCDVLFPILEEVTNLLVHKNTDLKVLEIGAGTGGTTNPVLSAFSGTNAVEQRLGAYFYTDISHGFFENARERFKKFTGIEYRILDIEKPPADQGFEEGSFDVVFAGNVLHATSSMINTMKNVRKLLKPGGKLIMVEITSKILRLPFIMGILPGWWLGVDDGRRWSPTLEPNQWASLLKDTGFSGIDLQVDDYANKQDQLYSVLISTAIEPTAETRPGAASDCNVSVVYRERGGIVEGILEELRKHKAPREVQAYSTTSKKTRLGDQVLVLAEITSPMLSNITSDEWDGIKHLIGHASSILWITFGGQMEAYNPEAAMINGLARCIRSETGGAVEFYSLDLDPADISPKTAVTTILKCLQRMQTDASLDGPRDFELAERNGIIYINRLVPDAAFEEEATALLGLTPVQASPAWTPRSTTSWTVNIQQPGSLETIGFVEDSQDAVPLPSDWVEIQVEAVGLNWIDVLTSLGYSTANGFDLGIECAGIVTNLGKEVVSLKIGDRVCAFGKSTFRSHYRTQEQLCKTLPTNMTFEDAAGIVVVFTTILYALRDIARITKDQTILIHSATGGLGLAAVHYCRRIGCQIFATVSTEEKKTYLVDNLNIPRENIFSSRDSSFFKGLMRRTKRKGVDVVLSSVFGDLLHYSWRCVKKYGYLLDLRKVDVIEGGKLDMMPFNENRTFRSINLADYAESRPSDCGRLIEDALGLFGKLGLRQLNHVKTFPANQVQEAFRYMQGPDRIGKTVIAIDKSIDPAMFQPSRRTFHIPFGGTVFLVGGLGGLGRSFSRFIAESGVNHVTFISRSGAKPEDAKFIDLLEDMGCKTYAAKGDISVRADVERILKEVCMPVIGVVQAAMVLDDQLFSGMSLESFQNVTSSKVHGTMNLHNALINEPIKFFVLLSSAGGIVGHQGQANYSAGNSFLDSFARMRKRLGLPVSVLDLGIVADVGWVAQRPEVEAAIRAQGYFVVQEQEFLRLLQLCIEGRLDLSFPFQGRDEHASVQIITGLTPPKLGPDVVLLGERALWIKDARFASLMATANKIQMEPNSTNSSNADTSAVQCALSDFDSLRDPNVVQKSSAEEITTKLTMGLLAKLSVVLGSPLESLNPEKRPANFGLDSLVGVELRAWIRRTFSFDVAVHEILNAESCTGLARFIYKVNFASFDKEREGEGENMNGNMNGSMNGSTKGSMNALKMEV